MLKKDQRISS